LNIDKYRDKGERATSSLSVNPDIRVSKERVGGGDLFSSRPLLSSTPPRRPTHTHSESFDNSSKGISVRSSYNDNHHEQGHKMRHSYDNEKDNRLPTHTNNESFNGNNSNKGIGMRSSYNADNRQEHNNQTRHSYNEKDNQQQIGSSSSTYVRTSSGSSSSSSLGICSLSVRVDTYCEIS
jgi:hypothetical protein